MRHSKTQSKGNYVLLTGDKQVSVNNDKHITESKSSVNKNGDVIKVIMISSVATEGVDFKNVREIHILEPWYNMSQIEQVTGRGVRKNSHIDLIESKRNTTIYLHANIIKDSPVESVDFRMYRTSIMKQLAISKLERIIKSASVDCNLNKNANYYPRNFKKIDILTSQKELIKDFPLGDVDHTRICDYTKCKYDCVPIIDKKKPSFIKNTELIEYDIRSYVKNIIKIYEKKQLNFITYNDIAKHFKNKYILDHALAELISKDNYYLVNKVKGKFIYKSNKYIFLPSFLEDQKAALSYRDYIQRSIPRRITLNNVKSSKEKPKEPRSLDIKSLQDTFNKYLVDENDMLPIIYSIAFDMLNKTDQLTIIESLLNDSNIDGNLRHMLEDSGVVTIDNGEISAYINIYDDEMYTRVGRSFIKASEAQMENNRAEFVDVKVKPFINSKLYGFIEINKKKKNSVFKMADKDSLENNQRKTIIGTICYQTSHITNRKMRKYLGDVDLKIKGNPTKPELCLLYEYGLRKQKSHFLRPRHFKEYKDLQKN